MENQLGSMSTISGEDLETDNGTTSPFTHSLDELDTELLTFLELLHSSISNESPPPAGEKKKQMRKHDIRRYFATMFNNIINSMDFDLILSYFETFMNADATLDIIFYPAPSELESSPNSFHHVRVEGPHTTSFYLMCLGVFFPDMVSHLINGQVVTSESLSGCKLVLETGLKCTRLFDVSIELALQQMTVFYDHYRCSMAMFPHLSKSHSRSTDSDSPSNRRRVERKAPKKRQYDHDDCLQMNIRSFVDTSPIFSPPRVMRLHCTYVIVLDARNHITSISVTATEER